MSIMQVFGDMWSSLWGGKSKAKYMIVESTVDEAFYSCVYVEQREENDVPDCTFSDHTSLPSDDSARNDMTIVNHPTT